MKPFWVHWTYLGNYCRPIRFDANSAEEAAKAATCIFSKDFHEKGVVYVFETEPVLVIKGPKA